MPALDSSIPHVWAGAAAITIEGDGASESTSFIFEGTFTWTQVGRTAVESRKRGRHHETKPVVVETDDGDVAISMSGEITSYLGSSSTYPYEAFTKSGTASSWTSTVDGGAHAVRLVYRSLEPESGATQTATFNYCHPDSVKIDPKGSDGKAMLEVELTDYENKPTWT
jgi:hypothetical protein